MPIHLSPPSSEKRMRPSAVNSLFLVISVPKPEKASQTQALWDSARGQSGPGRQRTRAEEEEEEVVEGCEDGWRKKLHRGGHLIAACDANINRPQDGAARRCERPRKQACKEKGRERREAERSRRGAGEDGGFQRHCDPLRFNPSQRLANRQHNKYTRNTSASSF